MGGRETVGVMRRGGRRERGVELAVGGSRGGEGLRGGDVVRGGRWGRDRPLLAEAMTRRF